MAMDMAKKYATNKRWNDRNKDKIKILGKKYREEHKKEIYEKKLKWKNENRERYNLLRKKYRSDPVIRFLESVRCKTWYAVKVGKLTRKYECEKCGSRENVQIHHKDYSNHLDVLFLCRDCHIAVHGNKWLSNRAT